MAIENTYTSAQVAVAAQELRQAAGTEEARFTPSQVIAMLHNEIRMLRERGFTDKQIADLFTGFDIGVTTEQIAQHAPPTL